MRTIKALRSRAIRFWPLILVMMIATPLSAQSKEEPPRLTISTAAGFAHPFSDTFADCYGSAQWPLSVQTEFELSSNIYAFSAFGYLGAEGNSVVEQAFFEEETYPLRFRMYSAKFGGLFRKRLGKVVLDAGGGFSSNWYREEMEGLDFAARGTSAGLLVQATAGYPIGRRFSLLGRCEFSWIPSSPDPELPDTRINLGGIELAAGLRIRLF